ncbi:MAG: 1,4-beta-xylanase [Pedosphaera sp.]|nr:1,4-beta-xylanase [Pedosphaera sp.]
MDSENSSHIPRRDFLRWSTAATVTAAFGQLPAFAEDTANQLGAEDATASSAGLSKDTPYIRVLFHEADGKPLESERTKTLHARDLANDPLPQPISTAEGRARIGLASEPIQLSMRLNVPGFGEVYCYADNHGKGYTKPGNIEFVTEAVATRLQRVRAAAKSAKKAGVPADAEFDKHLEAASHSLPKKEGTARIAAAYEALAHGLHAGERLTLNAARHRISRFAKPRKEFLFGCNSSGHARGGEYEKLFTQLFNYATISWYTWGKEQPESARINYDRKDLALNWCLAHKIVPKGFGYVYLANGATPEWLRSWPYKKILPEYKRVVAQTMRRYSGRLPHVEVINEAHDKANLFRLSHQQILELTREACKAAREGSPTVKRLINHCCMWAEYGKRTNADGVRRWSPYRYLADCVKAGVEFETVGLQLYYPQHDLFEMERMLDRFKDFKKPIQITEMGCNSMDGLDAASMRPKSLVPGWHGPWTETMQADWIEGIYTLCYSKPEFEAAEWWDFVDVGGHFWPHGGLLHKDLSPKEGYRRLLKLQKDWGVAKSA